MDISRAAAAAIHDLDKLVPSLAGMTGKPQDWDVVIDAEIAADNLIAALRDLHVELEHRRPLNVDRVRELSHAEDHAIPPMSEVQAAGLLKLVAGA